MHPGGGAKSGIGKELCARSAKCCAFIKLLGTFVIVNFRNAKYDDIPRMMEIFADARKIMRSSGNLNQWNDNYPNEEIIRADIDAGVSYVAESDGQIVGTLAFIPGPDPTYSKIYEGQWPDNEPYYVIHRIAACISKDSNAQSNKGFAEQCFNWALQKCGKIRIDTHRDNVIMHHILKKYGFEYCGVILLANGDPRDAYIK